MVLEIDLVTSFKSSSIEAAFSRKTFFTVFADSFITGTT